MRKEERIRGEDERGAERMREEMRGEE